MLNTNQGISRFRGEWFDYRGSKLIATYHPAYLLRNPPREEQSLEGFAEDYGRPRARAQAPVTIRCSYSLCVPVGVRLTDIDL